MSKTYKIIGSSLLAFTLSGCFELPANTHLLTAAGVVSVQECRTPDLIPTQQQALPQEFGVTVWNLYKGQRENWLAGMDRFARDQDLLLLQESRSSAYLSGWLKNAQLDWHQLEAFRYQDETLGVMTAAKVPLTFACGVRSAEPLIRVPKSGLVSLYALEGQPEGLLVINLHAINFELRTKAFESQLAAVTQLLHEHKGAVIFAGDFNTWSRKRQYHLERLVAQFDLREAVPSPDNRIRAFGHALDHLYYRGLEVVQVTSPQTEYSDHNPIVARFKAA